MSQKKGIQSPRVAILVGSPNDFTFFDQACQKCGDLGLGYEMRALSAHRTPDQTRDYVLTAETKGIQVFIAAAGAAAHLAGFVAALTLRPVIGVPLNTSPLLGLDALLATVQMPAGVPVATMAVGVAGATNSVLFAARILALQDKKLGAALQRLRVADAEKVLGSAVIRKGPNQAS